MSAGFEFIRNDAASEDELIELLGLALHSAPGGMRDWLGRIGGKNFRAVRAQGQLVAGLGYVPMAQWFGGVAVPCMGITAVGVDPAARGTGVGSRMLAASLHELRAQGWALAALYPATVPFYQHAGYERAATRVTYELPLAAIDVRDYALPIRAVAADDSAIRQLYAARAAQISGQLERPEWLWQLRLAPPDKQPWRFVVGDDKPEGYIVFSQAGRADPLLIHDLCVATPAASRRLLTLLAGYRSMVQTAVWSGGPVDPLVYGLRETHLAGQSRLKSVASLDLMLRIVDVAAALTARGYGPGVSGELHLAVEDTILAENSGRYVLRVADGRASVERGGRGELALGIRELAALYSGFAAPAELAVLGSVSGPPAALALATTIFAGPRPWLPDMF